MVLLPSLDNDSYLKKRTIEGKPLLTCSDLKELLKLKDRNFSKITKELKDVELLIVEGRGKNQKYKLNPQFHIRGKLPEDIIEVVRIQNRGIRALYEESNIKLDTIGFIYLILPYVSYKNCVLVKDVNKPDDLDNALSLEDLYKEIGMTEKTAKKYLKLKFHYKFPEGVYEIPAFVWITNPSYPKKKATMVHPILIRRNEEVTGEIHYSDLSIIFKMMGKKI